MNLVMNPEGDLEADVLSALARRQLVVRVETRRGEHFDLSLTDCRHSGQGGLLAIFGQKIDDAGVPFGDEQRVFLNDITELYVY